MSRLANTITAIASAGALAGGTALYYMGGETPEKQETEVVDDVAAVTVEIPKVNVPVVFSVKVDRPEVAAVKIAVPEVSGFEAITTLELERLGLPQVMIDEIKANKIVLDKVATPSVADPAARIPEIQKFARETASIFKDKRGIHYDRSFGIDNTALKAWIEIYRRNEPYTLDYVPLQKEIRMIAEVHYPVDVAVLDKNLEFYAAQGYNSVLLVFGNYKDETLAGLLDLVSYIRSKDMSVWFAYGGPERLEHSVFMDPVKYASWLNRLAAVCDGFIIGWRRTSLHLFLQDPQWIAYTLKNVRAGNPKIPVLGEVYFGQTAASNENTAWLTHNVPANSSGAMIFGFGLGGIGARLVLPRLTKIKDMDRVSVIIGEKSYYATAHSTGKTFQQNLAIKQTLEKQWREAGCTGTITLHGDGSDGIYNKLHNDNLANMEVQK